MQNISKSTGWFIMIILSIIWGSSFILIKTALVGLSPLQVGGLRVGISSICFIPIMLYHWKSIDWSKWKYFLIVGLCGSGIPAFLYPIAQTHVDSSIAGILNALTPIFTLLAGIVIFKKVFKVHYLYGILIGLLGVILISSNDIQSYGLESAQYYLCIVLATICYGISANTIEANLKEVNPIIVSALSFSMLLPLALLGLLYSDFFQPATLEVEPMTFGAVFCLAILGTYLSTMVFYALVQKTSAVFGSLVAYLIPIVALAWGLYFGEQFGIREIMGMSAILFGVYLSRNI